MVDSQGKKRRERNLKSKVTAQRAGNDRACLKFLSMNSLSLARGASTRIKASGKGQMLIFSQMAERRWKGNEREKEM